MLMSVANRIWNDYFKFNCSLDQVMFRNVRHYVYASRVLLYAVVLLVNDYEWLSKRDLVLCLGLSELFLEVCYQVYNKYFISDVDILKVLCHTEFGPGKYAAIMYFYGYLHKVLPVPEYPQQPEIAKRMMIYECEEKVKIPIKQLFILNPKSGRTEPIIGKNSDMIEKRKGLPPLELQRAGVDKRCYNHSVYKLFLEEKNQRGVERKHINVVAEYASPLTTIKDLSQVIPVGNQLLECNLSTFTDQLELLLKSNPHCGKYCQVISFDDNKEDAVTALRTHVLQLMKKLPTENKVPENIKQPSYEDSLENDRVSNQLT